MSQTVFHVSKNEQTLGPWTLDEIVERLGRAEIAVTDFVYDEGKEDWIPLLECTALKERLQKSKPKARPPQASTAKAEEPKVTTAPAPTSTQSTNETVSQASSQTWTSTQAAATGATLSAKPGVGDEWFVLKGEHRYGPFTYLGLVRALQEKTVYEFDQVWKEGMDAWVRMAEHEAFQPEKIRELRDKMPKGKEVFFERRMPRIPYDSDVIVHDDKSAWVGQAFEGSAGGSGLVIANATLVPGQVVRIHFSSVNGLPAFNAVAEIVAKKFDSQLRGANSPVKYAVRYLSLDAAAEKKVQTYFSNARSENDKVAQSR